MFAIHDKSVKSFAELDKKLASIKKQHWQGHRREQAAFKKAIHQMIRHAAGDLLRGHFGGVEERAALRAVRNEAAPFHLVEHGGDGGVSEPGVVIIERVEDFGNCGFVPFPQHLHNTELEIAEPMRFVFCHGERIITTEVVLSR